MVWDEGVTLAALAWNRGHWRKKGGEAMAPKWAEAAQMKKKKCSTRCENLISLKQHDKNWDFRDEFLRWVGGYALYDYEATV
jgi:hypothetical protein